MKKTSDLADGYDASIEVVGDSRLYSERMLTLDTTYQEFYVDIPKEDLTVGRFYVVNVGLSTVVDDVSGAIYVDYFSVEDI